MIKTTAMLLEENRNYRSPANKLGRMVSDGEIVPIIRGLYETDKATSAYLLAGSIYGPSYLSFEYALSRYGLIPETAYVYTSATFEKKRKKRYETSFGVFTYRDVPSEVYPYDVCLKKEDEYTYLIATAEKALCDLLYARSPVSTQKELKALLLEDLRIDEGEFSRLDKEKMITLARGYHCKNLKLLAQMLRRR